MKLALFRGYHRQEVQGHTCRVGDVLVVRPMPKERRYVAADELEAYNLRNGRVDMVWPEEVWPLEVTLA
jgi:hypothetical protein